MQELVNDEVEGELLKELKIAINSKFPVHDFFQENLYAFKVMKRGKEVLLLYFNGALKEELKSTVWYGIPIASLNPNTNKILWYPFSIGFLEKYFKNKVYLSSNMNMFVKRISDNNITKKVIFAPSNPYFLAFYKGRPFAIIKKVEVKDKESFLIITSILRYLRQDHLF